MTKRYLLIATVAFLLHLCWEYAHIHLYTGYEAMRGLLPVPILATLGDVLYTLLIIGVMSLCKRHLSWIADVQTIDLVAAAALGAFVALMVEYKGLYLGRWDYLPGMPLIPLLGVGLSPILQMTLLTPVTLFVAGGIYSTIERINTK